MVTSLAFLQQQLRGIIDERVKPRDLERLLYSGSGGIIATAVV